MKGYLTAAIVALLLFVAAPWGIGKLAEQRVDKGLDQLVETAPYLSIVEREWRRGWFTSEQEVTFEIFGPWLRALQSKASGEAAGSPGAAAGPLKFTVRNHILHGPVLWFTGVGIARVDSQLVLPEAVRAELSKMFGERSPVEVSTRLRFFGGGTTTFSGEARDFEPAHGGRSLSYDDFELEVGYSSHFDDVEVEGDWPRLEFTDRATGVGILVKGMVITGASQRVRGDLYDGDFDLSAEESRVVGADKQVTEVADLHYVVDTTIDDDFMDVALKIGSGAVKAREIDELGISFEELHYDFTLRRLHVDTLVKLMKEIKASYARPVSTAADVDAAMMQPLKEYGLELLKRDPELVIDRIGVTTPEGDAYLKGIIRLKGVNEQDFAAGPMGMLGKLEADITFEMAQKLVAKIPNGLSAVATAIDQGYLKRERDQVVSRLEYKSGVLRINGKEQGIPGLGPPRGGVEADPVPGPE
jgi:uncharacterized protein YdgA (DUF945 family)